MCFKTSLSKNVYLSKSVDTKCWNCCVVVMMEPYCKPEPPWSELVKKIKRNLQFPALSWENICQGEHFCLVFAFALFRSIFRVNSPITSQVLKRWQCRKCTELVLVLTFQKPVFLFCKDMGVKEKFFYPVTK